MPVAPIGAAFIAVILVRALIWTKTKSVKWNIAVCGLAMAASFASIEGSSMSVFYGFWMGVGYGGIGVGIIEFGKSALLRGLGERFSEAASVLFNMKSKEEVSNESDSQSDPKL